MGKPQIYKLITLETKAVIFLLLHDIVWKLTSYFSKHFKLRHQVAYNGHFWLRQIDAVTNGDSSCNRVTGIGSRHWNAYRVLNALTDYNC